jgi:hypothetical protein
MYIKKTRNKGRSISYAHRKIRAYNVIDRME